MPDLTAFLSTPQGYATQDQLDKAQDFAYALMKNRPKEKFTHWAQGLDELASAIAGRARLNDVIGRTNLLRDKEAKTSADIVYGGDSASDATGNTNVASAGGDDYINRLIKIESGGNPAARTGRYRGLGQFGPDLERKYGITEENWKDPNVQVNAIKRLTSDNAAYFKAKMGRDPTPGEMYLMHQQGAAGASALLKAGDTPAWRAIRPFYKSDRMAQEAIYGNIPNGSPLKNLQPDQIPASAFSNMWTSRFNGVKPPDFSGRMSLGGPKPGDTATPDLARPDPNIVDTEKGAAALNPAASAAQPGQPASSVAVAPNTQVAQAGPAPATSGNPAGLPPAATIPDNYKAGDQIHIPGYNGPVPLIPRIESRQEVENYLRNSMTPLSSEQRMKYLDAVRERRSIKNIPVQNGVLQVDPVNKKIQFIPASKDLEIDVGGIKIPMGTRIDQNGNASYYLKIPGANNAPGATPGANNAPGATPGANNAPGATPGANNGLEGLDPIMDWKLRRDTMHTENIEQAKKDVDTYNDKYNTVLTHGFNAQAEKSQLALAHKLLDTEGFIAGPLADKRTSLSKLSSIFGNSDTSLTFDKLIAGLSLNNIRSLGGQGLGQIRVAEMNLINQMNANRNMTKGAIKAVLEINQRLNDRVIEMARQAQKYKEEHGRLDVGFDRQIQRYSDKNPIISDEEIEHYKKFFQPDYKEAEEAPKSKTPKQKNRFNPFTEKFE